MNDVFSFSRFGLLLKTDLSSNIKKYSMWLLLIWGILIAMVSISIMNNYRTLSDPDYYNGFTYRTDPVANFMEVIFYLSLFLTTAIAASMTMQNLSTKATRINSLMLPATSLEKFLSRWCIFVPAYLVLFLVSFQLIDWLRVGVEMMIFTADSRISPLNVISMLSTTESGMLIVVCPLVLIQSLYVLGSTIWPKNSLLKTTCALFIICMALTLFTMLSTGLLVEFTDKYTFNPSSHAVKNFFKSIILSVTVISYIIAYFRYKEIEIIQRW